MAAFNPAGDTLVKHEQAEVLAAMCRQQRPILYTSGFANLATVAKRLAASIIRQNYALHKFMQPSVAMILTVNYDQ